MISDYCETVKRGRQPAEDFPAFLRHVEECSDCQRRIFSQMVIKFKQYKMEI